MSLQLMAPLPLLKVDSRQPLRRSKTLPKLIKVELILKVGYEKSFISVYLIYFQILPESID